MTARLNKEFMPAFIERAIQFHARRGIRWWCDCSFCTAKKLGTLRIGNFSFISRRATSYSNKYRIPPPYVPDEWNRGSAWAIDEYWRRIVADTREQERVRLRAELKDLREQVI